MSIPRKTVHTKKKVKDHGPTAANGARERRTVHFETLESRVLLSGDMLIPPPEIAPPVAPEPPPPPVTETLAPAAEAAAQPVTLSTAIRPPDSTVITEQPALPSAPVESVSSLPPAMDDASGVSYARKISQQPDRQIVVVDPAVTDYGNLIDSLTQDASQVTVHEPGATAPIRERQGGNESDPTKPSFDVFILDQNRDGLDQISGILADQRNVGAVHILSHGAAGFMQVGDTPVTSAELDLRAQQLGEWKQHLVSGGDILLYGCNIAEGEAGIAFVRKLADVSALDVAASGNDTGSATLGGDWRLEYTTGAVEATSLFTRAPADYRSLLLDFADVSGDGSNLRLSLRVGNDRVALEQYADDAGKLRLYETDGGREYIFAKPVTSLTINLGVGDDSFDLCALGNIGCSLTIEGGLGSDSITFAGSSVLSGGSVSATAETITANTGVVLDTGSSGGAAGSISLAAETIDIGAGARLIALGQFGGADGDITLAVSVADYSGLSPLDVFPAEDVSITVGAGAQLKGGMITLSADRTSRTASPLTVVAVQSKSATITLRDAIISGTGVSIAATAADESLLGGETATYFDNYLLGPLYSNVIATAISSIPVLGPALQAVSVSIRSAETRVTLDGTTITSIGDVSITSGTSVESAAGAQGGLDLRASKKAGAMASQLAGAAPIAVSYGQADVIASTELTGGASITAGGNVTVAATGSNTTEASSYTATNSGPGKKNIISSVGASSIAVTKSSTAVTTLVDAGVTITAGGNADISATGETDNSADAGVSVFVDGFGGVGIALGLDDVDIHATASGTITAGGAKTVSDLKLADINTASDTITIPGHGLQTGQELVYLAADPAAPDTPLAAIVGLESGATYRVVVVDENTIQLVRGRTIDFDAGDTQDVNPDSVQSLSRKAYIDFEPESAADATTNTISFARAHGLTTGQTVDYLVASNGGEAIGGLENEGTYIVAKVDGTHIKLGTFDSTSENITAETFTVDGQTCYVIDLSGGSATSSTVSFDPTRADTDTGAAIANNEIVFAEPHQFITGEQLIYATGGGTAIDGLVNGGTYYAIVTGTDRIQLAGSKVLAESGTALVLDGTLATVATDPDGETAIAHSFRGIHTHLLSYEEAPLEFTVADAVETAGEGTIDFGYNHGLATGDAVVYRPDLDFSREIALMRGTQFSLADSTVTFNPGGVAGDDEAVIGADGSTIVLDVLYDFVTGQRVHYDAGGGTAIGGLTDHTDYYVITSGYDRLQLALTRGDALAGIAITGLSATGATGSAHTLTGNAVDLTDNLLVMSGGHTFETGQQITYATDGGTPIGGLTNGQAYYAIRGERRNPATGCHAGRCLGRSCHRPDRSWREQRQRLQDRHGRADL